jgi:hemerythrin-like domain-containing protein
METPVRQVTRRLHEEHVATLALWSRVEASLTAGNTDAALMRAAATALAGEIERHFVFEEKELFPRLAAAGEGDLGELLAEEHVPIRAAAARFIALVEENSFRDELRVAGRELAERLASHVHKEEMSLLPAVDQLLDEGADHELACAYAAL